MSVTGGDVECAWFGADDARAPIVVLLHEGLGSISAWGGFPLAAHEALGMPVFAYSRIGYGQSTAVTLPRPLDYLHHEALTVLPEVLRAIGFHDGILYGHSDGASIATIYAGTGERSGVRGVVLEAPHIFVEQESIDGVRKAAMAYETGGLRERLARHHQDVDGAFYGWRDAWLDEDFRRSDIRREAASIPVPMLFIQGEDDPYGTLAQLRALEGGARERVDSLILPGCGHAPHREKRDGVLRTLMRFAHSLYGS